MTFLNAIVKSTLDSASRYYKGVLGARLKAVGLKYHDLAIENVDVVKAVERSSAQVRQDRERRMRRAFDAGVKKKTMPSEVQDYNPFDLYLQKHIRAAEFERLERARLNK